MPLLFANKRYSIKMESCHFEIMIMFWENNSDSKITNMNFLNYLLIYLTTKVEISMIETKDNGK